MAEDKDELSAAEASVADAQETVTDAADVAEQAVADAADAVAAEVPDVPELPEVVDVPEAAEVPAASEPVELPEPPATPATEEIDPDLAAFEAAERDYPGLFSTPTTPAPVVDDVADDQPRTVLGSSDPNESHDSLAAAVTPPLNQATQVLPAEPVADATAAYPAPEPTYPAPNYGAQQSPILVPAPEPPYIKGNRTTIALIGLLAALSFAVLYFLVDFVVALVNGTATFQGFVDFALSRATDIVFWVPTIVFYIGFWFLGLFVNRAKWGKWVFFSFVPGLFAWGGVVLGALIADQFWSSSTAQIVSVAQAAAITLSGLVAFLIGREVTVWYSKWAAHSGAKKIARYEEEEAEYERTIEAGPQL